MDSIFHYSQANVLVGVMYYKHMLSGLEKEIILRILFASCEDVL